MRSRPTEPTAALAALISGNHRHLAVRQNVATTGDEAGLLHSGPQTSIKSTQPFAAVVATGMESAELATVFDMPERGLWVLAAEGLQAAVGASNIGVLDCALATTSIVILVAVSRLFVPRFVAQTTPESVGHLGGLALADAERRSFDILERAFLESASLRGRVERRQVRAVAAVFDPVSGRVHWLGEHPQQARLVRG